jgi:hypothetical protein
MDILISILMWLVPAEPIRAQLRSVLRRRHARAEATIRVARGSLSDTTMTPAQLRDADFRTRQREAARRSRLGR